MAAPFLSYDLIRHGVYAKLGYRPEVYIDSGKPRWYGKRLRLREP